MSNQAIAPVNQNFMPALTIADSLVRRAALTEFVRNANLMVSGTDYGVIPGTDKPTLLKPGAEKLCTLFGLSPKFTVVEEITDWAGKQYGEPFFYFHYRCGLYRGETIMAEGEGSSNSMESKYRYRWVNEADVPDGVDKSALRKRGGRISEFAFGIDKAETTGKYGKPAAYWQKFQDAIQNGTATKIKKTTAGGKTFDAWEIDSVVYRVPNPDICDQVNTLQKMGQKRALIAAVLLAVNASEFFTQDLEDFDFRDAIEGTARVVTPPMPEPPVQATSGSGNGASNGHTEPVPTIATELEEARKNWLSARESAKSRGLEGDLRENTPPKGCADITLIKQMTNALKIAVVNFDAALSDGATK